MNFCKNGYVLCTVMFNTLEMPAHNTKMRKRHYSTTNMQKNTLLCVLFVMDQDRFLSWILHFKLYSKFKFLQQNKELSLKANNLFVFFNFFPRRKTLLF